VKAPLLAGGVLFRRAVRGGSRDKEFAGGRVKMGNQFTTVQVTKCGWLSSFTL